MESQQLFLLVVASAFVCVLSSLVDRKQLGMKEGIWASTLTLTEVEWLGRSAGTWWIIVLKIEWEKTDLRKCSLRQAPRSSRHCFFYSTSASLTVLLRAEPFSRKKRKRCPALAFSTLSLLENTHVFSQLDEIRRVLGPPGKRFFLGRNLQRQMAAPAAENHTHWHMGKVTRILQQPRDALTSAVPGLDVKKAFGAEVIFIWVCCFCQSQAF